jgi:arabinose-5-phosphate isomerase
MGDAMAVSLMELKGFTANDFAKFHPGGTLGKKLYLRVNDLSTLNEKPEVRPESTIKEVIVEMTRKRLGLTAVVDNAKLVGVITDGDLRRMLEKDLDIEHKMAKEIMSRDPKTIAPDALAVDALDKMRKNNITQLIVKTEEEYTGVIHLHDLLREGIV